MFSTDEFRRQVIEHVLPYRCGPVFVAGVLRGDVDEVVDAPVHVGGKPLEVGDTAEVCQQELRRRLVHDQVDRAVRLGRVEMDRGCGRVDELAGGGVQLAVGKAETVAGKNGIRGRVAQTIMVPRVTFREQEPELATGQRHRLAVVDDEHTLLGDRQDLAVHLRVSFRPVHRARPADQLLRVDHVRGAARMQYGLRVGQLVHQQAGAAGMIEVYVCQENIVDRTRVEVLLAQRIEQQRHAGVGAGIDKRGAPVRDQQVARVEQRPDVVGVDGRDAITHFRQQRLLVRHLCAYFTPAGVCSPSCIA